MMKHLERITYICLILTSIIATSVMVEQHISPKNQRRSTELVGTHLSLPEVSWNTATTHVVVALSSHCHFCVESLPFYRQLAEVSRRSNRQLSLTILTGDPKDTARGFLLDNQLVPDHLVLTSLSTISVPIRGTPTLLLVNSNGIVTKAFRGKLTELEETTLLKFLELGKSA